MNVTDTPPAVISTQSGQSPQALMRISPPPGHTLKLRQCAVLIPKIPTNMSSSNKTQRPRVYISLKSSQIEPPPGFKIQVEGLGLITRDFSKQNSQVSQSNAEQPTLTLQTSQALTHASAADRIPYPGEFSQIPSTEIQHLSAMLLSPHYSATITHCAMLIPTNSTSNLPVRIFLSVNPSIYISPPPGFRVEAEPCVLIAPSKQNPQTSQNNSVIVKLSLSQLPLTYIPPNPNLSDWLNSLNERKDNFINAWQALGTDLMNFLNTDPKFLESFKKLLVEFHGYMDFSSKPSDYTNYFQDLLKSIHARFELSTDELIKLENQLRHCFRFSGRTQNNDSQDEEHEKLISDLSSKPVLSQPLLEEMAELLLRFKIEQFTAVVKKNNLTNNGYYFLSPRVCHWLQRSSKGNYDLKVVKVKSQNNALIQIKPYGGIKRLNIIKTIAKLWRLTIIEDTPTKVTISKAFADALFYHPSDFTNLRRFSCLKHKGKDGTITEADAFYHLIFKSNIATIPNPQKPIAYKKRKRLTSPHALPSSSGQSSQKKKKSEPDVESKVDLDTSTYYSVKFKPTYSQDEIVCLPIRGGSYELAMHVAKKISRMPLNEIKDQLETLRSWMDHTAIASEIREVGVQLYHDQQIQTLYDRLLSADSDEESENSQRQPSVYIYELDDDKYRIIESTERHSERSIYLCRSGENSYDAMVVLE